MNHKEFFCRYGEHVVPARYYESRAEFTVEEMFQAFRERLKAENRAPGQVERIADLEVFDPPPLPPGAHEWAP